MFARMVFSDKTKVLDIACGTGLVTFNLARLNVSVGYVVGLDLSPAMLRIANRKKHAVRSCCEVDFVRGVGEFLPFHDGFFRYVTVGLALPNLGDKMAVFQESLRVLLQQGWFLSVDFARPENVLVWRVFRFHIFYVTPDLEGLVSSHWKYTLIYNCKFDTEINLRGRNLRSTVHCRLSTYTYGGDDAWRGRAGRRPKTIK
jgi:ubiquinone/menaquinone biosynthesis C-methylase UbiE